MSEEPQAADPTEATARSPMAGCIILIVAFLVMIFLVVFSVFTLFRQYKEIVKFTDDKPAEIELVKIEDKKDEIAAFSERLDAFRAQLSQKVEARLELTPADINFAIAVYEPLKELRETFWVESIDGEVMRIQVSYPLNGVPRLTKDGEEGMITTDMRYLNGVMVARPVLANGQIILKLDDIEVEKAEVPEEFTQQMSPYRPTERYIEHETLGPVMAKLTEVSMEPGKLILGRVPGDIPANEISDEEVDQAAGRFFAVLGGAACLFLIFAGVMIFIGLRAKAGQSSGNA